MSTELGNQPQCHRFQWQLPAVVLIIQLLMIVSLCSGCSDDVSAPVSSDSVSSTSDSERRASHLKMLEMLQAMHLDAQENHPFLGIRQLRVARENLQNVKDSIPDPELSTLHGIYGAELLRAGDSAEAVIEMEAALSLLEKSQAMISPDLLQQVRYQVAIAHLRDGENANCVHCINGERCLFPIVGAGVHEKPEGSRLAAGLLEKVLDTDPNDVKSRWLLNIAYMTLGEYPDNVPARYLIPPERFEGVESPIGEFRNVAKPLGLGVLGCAGGVIVDDFDGDLDLDIFFSTWATDGQLRYFRNNADGTFSDATEEANLTGIYGGLNLIQADYDNDGDLDVLVLRGAWLEDHGRHPKSLLQNDGTGKFWDVSTDAGLADRHFPTQSASWGDYDLDGDLDLFVGNEGFPSQLFENDGQGRFVNVSRQTNTAMLGSTKGCIFGDYNGDDYPDIYISNLQGPNQLLKNNGDKTFIDVAREAGVLAPMKSFAVWFWDMNNDGFQDLFVGSYEKGIEHVARDYLGLPGETEPDCFYMGTTEGKFVNRTKELGYSRVTQPMGVNFGDIDNDGFLDFYLGTGYVDYEGLIPNLLFHNHRGERLDDITFSARVGHLQKGHGVALADIDNDGDEDIVAVMGGWFAGDAFARAVFENPGTKNHWVTVRLHGTLSNRYGIGSRIRATFEENGELRSVYRWVNSGGSFGANPLRIHLGIGTASVIRELEVYWPKSKIRRMYSNVPADQFVEIREEQDEYEIRKLPAYTLASEAAAN